MSETTQGPHDLRFGFAGDRDIAVRVLDYLIAQGRRPEVLMVSGADRASHDSELIQRCDHLSKDRILRGSEFSSPDGVRLLSTLDLALIIGVHFPYIVPSEILHLPRVGVVNLHPAYLPFNRGWHTPSWAILDGTPAGATLHFMSEELDAGDIIHRKQLAVSPGDTAHSLYQRLKDLEFEVFVEAWPTLMNGSYQRIGQGPNEGTAHRRSELLSEEFRRLDLDSTSTAGEVLRKLRAHTTSSIAEAAFFEIDGRRFSVQLTIVEEAPGAREP